ncbi:MAG: toxin-antitoxin system HicB family antitoxin [Ruminococcus sp.]|nr:toxin-antitoxin system HicB family antitoxin [Ruminococcus sp.]
MAKKKSFIDNPAMQFISGETNEVKPAGAKGENGGGKKGKAGESKAVTAGKSGVSGKAAAGGAGGKSAKSGSYGKSGAVRPVAPRRQGESKSKRVQLLMPPSLHLNVAGKAAEMGVSFNEFVNVELEKIVKNS